MWAELFISIFGMFKVIRVQKIWACENCCPQPPLWFSLCKICSRNETLIASDPSRMMRRKPCAILQSTLWSFRIIYVLGVLLLQKFCTKCPWAFKNRVILQHNIRQCPKTPSFNFNFKFTLNLQLSLEVSYFLFHVGDLSFSYLSSEC